MDEITRREALKLMAVAGATSAVGCTERPKGTDTTKGIEEKNMSEQASAQADAIIGAGPLPAGVAPWPTPDPFLFCVHHDDAYPAGNEQQGPAASLSGRRMGEDFEGRDGWRMYHGMRVPGFPQHPHRGFETVTVVRRGLLDHSDSLGATARYGRGDVQWLTAGSGINHAEMFPLVEREKDNPVELFQIWLNLPRANKLVQPHFTMLWDNQVPRHEARDAQGRVTTVTVVAGRLGEQTAAPPPPKSWASQAESDLAIWTIKMQPGATWTIPAAKAGTNRRLYFFQGRELRVAGQAVPQKYAVDLRPDAAVQLEAGADEVEILMLQGRPIGEPVVQYGPFVMNSREEIRQTILEYQQTQFGGWPWQREDPVHPREEGRFAKHADGRVERPS